MWQSLFLTGTAQPITIILPGRTPKGRPAEQRRSSAVVPGIARRFPVPTILTIFNPHSATRRTQRYAQDPPVFAARLLLPLGLLGDRGRESKVNPVRERQKILTRLVELTWLASLLLWPDLVSQISKYQ